METSLLLLIIGKLGDKVVTVLLTLFVKHYLSKAKDYRKIKFGEALGWKRIAEYNRGIRVIETTGTWRATVRNLQSIPEPDTVLGVATFGFVCFLLRGVASSKKA